MPVGILQRNSGASQHGAALEPSSRIASQGTESKSCAASICVRVSEERVCVRASSKPTSSPHMHLPLPLFLLGSPPSPSSSAPTSPNRPRNRQTPSPVPGMKSRAVVAEKTIQQAGWYILKLRCLSCWACYGFCCCYRCCLPLC